MLMFVYGSLKKDFPNHYMLKNSKFLGKAVTVDKLSMFKNKTGQFPCLSKRDEFNIKGELFEIDQSVLKDIDYFEGMPHFYYRDIIPISFEEGIVEAWTYFFTKQNELSGEALSEWI